MSAVNESAETRFRIMKNLSHVLRFDVHIVLYQSY